MWPSITHHTLTHAPALPSSSRLKIMMDKLAKFNLNKSHLPLFVDDIIIEFVELKIVVGFVVELGQEGAHCVLVTSNAAHDLFAEVI